jgi:hypothetical protein
MAFAMGWEILWPLILGFALSAVVEVGEQGDLLVGEGANLLPVAR